MRDLYDDLIENIPSTIKVKDYIIGCKYSMVKWEGGAGISKILNEERFPFQNELKENMSLKDLCSLIKSWNFIEASLGLAAINSYYNRKYVNENIKLDEIKNSISSFINKQSQSKIAFIDTYMENKDNIKSIYDTDFFNRNTEDGDYYISAFEYLSKEYDKVFLSSNLLINKHIKKSLKDSSSKFKIMSDMSAPLSLSLIKEGIDEVAGFVIEDIDKCFNLVKFGADTKEIRKTGKLMKLIYTKGESNCV